MTLKPLTVESLVAEQRVASYVRWHHFDRILRRLEEIHEMTQHARQREARAHMLREAELMPDTRTRIAETWAEAQREIDASRKLHAVPVERVIRPIPDRRERAS